MRLLPRSLLWRTFGLLALLVVATVAAWIQIFRSYEAEPRARQVAQNLVSIVNLTRTALVTAESAKRRDLLQELSEREGIQVYPAEPEEKLVAPPTTRNIPRILAIVREQLGPQTRFAMEREGVRGFWISFRIEEDEYWVRVPAERLERRQALQWLGWGMVALALALLAAWFIVRRITRPMRLLAAAAADIGQGRRTDPVPETGAAELQTLSRSFNQMARDLQRLDEDRALILAGVSHDLRTPLARLRLGVEMSGGDASLRDGMGADIDEMDRIISQFLDFARPDGGEAPQLLRLSQLANEVLEHQRRLGHVIKAGISETPEQPLRPLALRRALLNLLDNALRYGGGEVSLRVSADGGSAVAEVSDNGPGVPEAELERLKQPFVRLETARSGKGGSGLGLAIVDRVTRAHGGEFALSNQPPPATGLVAAIRVPTRIPG